MPPPGSQGGFLAPISNRALLRSPAGMRVVAAVALVVSMLVPLPASSEEIAKADLEIRGSTSSLTVVTISATTGIDIPVSIQTAFGGKQNDEVPFIEGTMAVAELTGPGLESPIRLETAPGRQFQIPGLSREGIYLLQNIRLMRRAEFLQSATPAVVSITVANVLQTKVRVRQLSPEELRARGITVDARNFDTFEYTFSFLVNGQTVEIPYFVNIDRTTRAVLPVANETPYALPPITAVKPPRWTPPTAIPTELVEDVPYTPRPSEVEGSGRPQFRPSIPAALIIPNSIGVMHQFFAVALTVTNGAPAGSSIELRSVNASLKTPVELRIARSNPAVSIGQSVPIVDASTGVTFLMAQATGEADWSVEGLRPGTHRMEVDIRAIYKSPGQPDLPLRAKVPATIVVHDPRFNITFSHPDTVRKNVEYSTFSFVTNQSPASQTIRISNLVPACSQSPGANVCRIDGTPESHDMTLKPGEMRAIEYRLRSGITGHVFATAGTVDGEGITAFVQLTMVVSESGIPLSPATLVLPHYAKFLDPGFLSDQLQLLGLGYSVATAPVNQTTAKFPRVIRSDVFQRAADLARAGQRIFIGADTASTFFHLALDLLGNGAGNDLAEWDELRRTENAGRGSEASLARQIERATLPDSASFDSFLDRFASVTAHRDGYLAVAAYGPAGTTARPYAVSLRSLAGRRMDIPDDAAAGWLRQIPYAQLSSLRSVDRLVTGELALAGRFQNTSQTPRATLDAIVTASVSGPLTIDVAYPSAAAGATMRARFLVTASTGDVFTVRVEAGANELRLMSAAGAIVSTAQARSVAAEPLRVVAARQDLHLDSEGHRVSVLFNRPVRVEAGASLANKFQAQINVNRDGLVYNGPRAISGAALQEDGRIANLNFDHALSQNATYSLIVAPLIDPLSGATASFLAPVVPTIDNSAPAGLVYGKVLKGDNSPIPGAQVILTAGARQYDLSRSSDASFLFEHVARDIDNGKSGAYELRAVTSDGKSTRLEGAVRLPGKVHYVNLVFLGRGTAEGTVRYDNGAPVPNARVTAGSTLFDQFRQATTDASGSYRISDLPVGPLTFSATDGSGNVSYAAAEVRTAGELIRQDLSIYRRPFPGTGTVRGIVRRSDTNGVVTGARVAVYSQGYGISETFSDAAGRFELTKIPSGFVRVQAAEWTVSRESVVVDLDLAPDQVRDNLILTLRVYAGDPLTAIEGIVKSEDPAFPGDPSRYRNVAGAVVKISGMLAVTADLNGRYVYSSVPASFAGRKIEAYDPSSRSVGASILPALDPAAANNVPIFIRTSDGGGTGTIRVLLLSAAGSAVSGFRVIEPGYPPQVLLEKGSGVYELAAVRVGQTVEIWAVAGPAAFGDQYATGTARVEFNGQVSSLVLRLPGQGIARVALRSDIDLIGEVKLSYQAWDEAEQSTTPKETVVSTNQNGQAGFATFSNVPSLANFTVQSLHPVYGYASQSGKLAFDGDIATITLQLNRLSTIRGTVYAIDGRTPIPGATVRLSDGRQDQGTFTTLPDGTFTFRNVAAGSSFQIVADVTQSGIYRTGFAQGVTPGSGGPIDSVAVVLRQQGSVEGRVVYTGFKVFDPANSANNIADDTPADLSDNAPVPLAKFYLRELDFPRRSFGDSREPLTADIDGRFALSNLFAGSLRVTGWAAGNQELRGDWQGAIQQEGERITTAWVAVGMAGFGPVVITVVDPNAQNAPVENAEVTIFRNRSAFDLATTDAAGAVRFEGIPADSYTVSAYSKRLGKSGSGSTTVVAGSGASLQIVLLFSGEVSGTLTDPEAGGRAVPGVDVTLSATSYETRATTTTAGGFLFGGVREGSFRLAAREPLSNRIATATRRLTQADPRPVVNLQLEPTETLHVTAFLPADNGTASSSLVPLTTIHVTQRCSSSCYYDRELQGNAFQLPGLFRNSSYTIDLKEVGGDERAVRFVGSFPKGSAADAVRLVLPAFGTVEARVTQGAAPAGNSKVTATAGNRSVTAYTDSSGVVTLRGLPLGAVSVTAVSIDGAFSGTAIANVTSQSTPAVVSLALGSYAGVTGLVEAEAGSGQPSVGTRVVASWGSSSSQQLTDATGRFTFQGIATIPGQNVIVSLVYIGPDEVTVGARQTVSLSSPVVINVPKVKLDATLPQLLTISPAGNAANVPPDSSIRFTFSEPIDSAHISPSRFQLSPAGGNTQVAGTFSSFSEPSGTFVVIFTPVPPSAAQQAAGQRYPLASNTLYRIVVSGDVADVTGNRLPAARGSSFTTTDYIGPKVVKVTPATDTPLQPATTFEIRFNKAIDASAFSAGGAGQIRLYRISEPGSTGTVIEEKAGRGYTDSTGFSLLFGPNDPIAPESFYRLTFSGVRDSSGNVLEPQTLHFFSFDQTKPFVNLVSPVPATFALVSGVEYILGTDIRNGSVSGTPATDVARVDFFRVEGVAQTLLASATAPPFSYRFVGPDVPEAGGSLQLRAVAIDRSGNIGNPATMSWSVVPNRPPQTVSLTVMPSSATYAGKRINAAVTFTDEGTLITVQTDLQATQTDGTAYSKSFTKQLTRATVDAPWPPASFDFDLPPTLREESSVTLSTTVTDVRGQRGTASSAIVIAADRTSPVILSMLPAAETRYRIGDRFRIETVVRDEGAGVASVSFNFDGQTIVVPAASATAGTEPGSFKFTTAEITTPAKNLDTRVAIVVTAADYRGNLTSRTAEVIYAGVNDPSVPRATWACPLEHAIWPASQPAFRATLRVRATDDIAITGVKFRVPGVTEPIAGVRAGATDIYEATVTIATGPAGTSLSFAAIVSDADATHNVEVVIPVNLVEAELVIDERIQAVTSVELASFTGKNVLVRGAAARLVLHVPLTLKNLMLLDGARAETLASTTTTEQKLNLTVTGSTYIDCDSSIDVSAKGYLGGWGLNSDGSGTRNQDARGRSGGNSVTGGAGHGSSGSHAGLGGESVDATNRVYGSIQTPSDPGAGGGGAGGCCENGAPGGGVVSLTGGTLVADLSRIIVAGAIRADGGSGAGIAGAGAGGSVSLYAKHLSVGPLARVTANGGDDDATDRASRGGGGGRVALVAMARLDASEIALQIQSRGGRNGSGSGGVGRVDGGAGTTFVKRPNQLSGELLISSADERLIDPTQQVRPTILGFIGSGISTQIGPASLTDSARTFGRGVVGEELILGSDLTRSFTVVALSADGMTVSTDPADGDLVAAAGSSAPAISYSGLSKFDRVELGRRALARFDHRLAVGSAIDDRTSIVTGPGAVALLYGDRPTVSLTTVQAAGSALTRATDLQGSYDAASLAGVASVAINFSPVTPDRIDPFYDFPTAKSAQALIIPVPPTASLGAATLRLVVTDRAGRRAESATASFTIVENSSPTIDRFDVTPSTAGVYPGTNLAALISAADDVAVKSISFSARIGSGVPAVESRSVSQKVVVDQAFSFAIPVTTPGGSTLALEASASDAFPGRAATTSTRSVAILRDSVAPAITITSPAPEALYQEGSGNTIPVRASVIDAEVAVREVYLQIDGGSRIAMTREGNSNLFRADVTIPSVDGSTPVARQISVSASDYEGNSTTAPAVTIRIQPLNDPNAPVVSWLCPSGSPMYPPGYTAKLRIQALGNGTGNAANGVQKAELFVDGSASAIAATAVPGVANQYEATYTIPLSATGGALFSIRAVVTNVAGGTNDATVNGAIVTGRILTTDTTIGPADPTYEDQTVIVQSGTTTISGSHRFARLVVLDGVVTHPLTSATLIERLDLRAADVYIACAGRIDVSGRGFVGSVNGYGMTWPNTTTGGSYAYGGGSHGGRGGRSGNPSTTTDTSALTYGSLYDPNTPGGASGYATADCPGCGGGGIVRIAGTTLRIDGKILADGVSRTYSSGAGGSIRLDASLIAGTGEIRARGGLNGYSSSGGGRIALWFGELTLDRAGISANAGSHNPDNAGAAGTLFFKRTTAANGELTIDNGSVTTRNPTTLTSVGFQVAAESSSTALRTTTPPFPAPDHLRGIRAIVDNNRSVSWPITSNSVDTIQLDTSNAPLTVGAGQSFRGLYRFDAITLRNANLQVADLLEVMSPIIKDAASSVGGSNPGPPLLDASRVSIQPSALGPSVVGTIGAVVDSDKPITIIATNARSAATFTGRANDDGSFAVGLEGQAGDSISIKARDSNLFPMDSSSVVVGTLPSVTAAPSQISSSAWTTDTNFRSRMLTRDGTTLVVGGYPLNSEPGSDKLAILSLVNPSTPILSRTVAIGKGAIRDVAAADGYAFVAANTLSSVSLTDPAGTAASASDERGTEVSLAVTGGYAFTGADWYDEGWLRVYDVSVPASPRYLREHRPLNGLTYRGLVAMGNEYLIGLTTNVVGGLERDVVVIDRRDVNNLVRVSDLAIPNFQPFRGRIDGTMLYLVSQTSPEMVSVDLSDPRLPRIAARTTLSAVAGQVSIAAPYAFVANRSTGLTAVDVSVAGSPVVSGSAATGGSAFDVALSAGYAYAANEQGLAVIPVTLPPLVDERRIALSLQGTLVTVRGSARSVSGQGPLSVEVKNVASGASVSGIAVASDGSFTASVGGVAGERLLLKVTDGASRVTSLTLLVPYGSAVRSVPISTMMAAGDAEFRARTLGLEGTSLIVGGSYPGYGTAGSDKLVIFDVASAGTLVQRRTVAVGKGAIRDVAAANGYAFVAANTLSSVSLTDPAGTVASASDQNGTEVSLVVAGGYAFTGADWYDEGWLRVYDVSVPASPRYLREHRPIYGLTYRGLVAMGNEYLIGLTTNVVGGLERDVVVIDRRDVSNLVRVSDLAIPGFRPIRGKTIGSMLYVGGEDGGLAIVDLTNPRAPQLVKVIKTPGSAHGVDLAGTVVAVADGGSGVSFVDAASGAGAQLTG
ncbi:MAG TPA: carboxypeptidase regulatory-like domain-containing protein, partial [Thermoanaerobaculia bacterium]|nr:carboxypeptidase regulatory-like domain-containing protein [Thermoanaerobaculia bacterium]